MVSALLGVDDGIAQGNFNLADVLFLIGAILIGLGALAAASANMNPPQTASKHAQALAYAGLCLVAFGWFFL